MELPLNILRSVRRYEPITTNGLTLYPVLTSEYEDFLMARPALEVMQQSFPVAFMRVPLLSALYQMDYEAAVSGTQPTGLFSRALLALALSLRLGKGKEPGERVQMFHVAVERDKPEKLMRLRADVGDENFIEIRPEQFTTMRYIMAAQNGVRIEDERANPNIVDARKKMAESGDAGIEPSVDDLLSGISALMGCDEADIETWPILKLQKRMESCQRMMDYIICGIGATQGTTWKGGNPVPHPFFRRTATGGGIFTPMGDTPAQAKTTPDEKAAIMALQTKNL